jgi:hypothetical protein
MKWTKQIIIERRPADDNDEGSIVSFLTSKLMLSGLKNKSCFCFNLVLVKITNGMYQINQIQLIPSTNYKLIRNLKQSMLEKVSYTNLHLLTKITLIVSI